MLLKSKEEFAEVKDRAGIDSTPAKKIALCPFDKELMEYCQKAEVVYAVKAASITEAVYANHFGAAFIVVSKERAKEIQEVAENYLFDAKILVPIRFEWEIERFARLGIDGVIL